MNSLVNSNEKFKLELMWKKGGFEVEGEHRFVKFHNGNIFHISYQNKIENCVEMFDLNGNLKWKYVCEKGQIVGWSFLENMLFVCWNSRDSLGNCLDSGIIALDYNGKIKYECNAQDIDGALWIMSMFSDGKYVAVWDSGLVCLLDIYEDGLKLRWKYDCNEEINDPEWATVWDVKICGEKVIVVSESCIFWFDINGNIKNKTDNYPGYEHCEIIKNILICSHHAQPITPPITAYYLDNGNFAWEFNPELNGGSSSQSSFISHWFKHKPNDYFLIHGEFLCAVSEMNGDGALPVYILNPKGELVNIIFVEDKFKEKLPGPNIDKNIQCLSVDDKYLGVGTFDGYFYLFTLEGEILSVWHAPLIDEEERKELTSIQDVCPLRTISYYGNIIEIIENRNIIEITENGVVRGNIYGEYYPITSLDLENNYVVISYNKEFVLLKIIAPRLFFIDNE